MLQWSMRNFVGPDKHNFKCQSVLQQHWDLDQKNDTSYLCMHMYGHSSIRVAGY